MKRTSIQSPYFAAYYHRLMKRKNGFKKGMIRDRGEILRLLSIIWKTVSEHYVEADAGVYVDNVGYLCHVLIPGQRLPSAGPGHREQARHQRLPLQPPGYGFRRL